MRLLLWIPLFFAAAPSFAQIPGVNEYRFSGLFHIPDFTANSAAIESQPFAAPSLTAPSFAATLQSTPAAANQSRPEAVPRDAPQWIKDLRRAEIVAFGSFPFTVFFSSFFVDLYRASSHGWDNRYMPWPFKGAGAVSMSHNELVLMFAIAVSASVTISITDQIIIHHKRSRDSRRAANE